MKQMKHMRWAASILLLPLGCVSQPPAPDPVPFVEAVHSNLLTVSDIRIAAGVDTTHAPTLDAVNCLRRYLTRKMDLEAHHGNKPRSRPHSGCGAGIRSLLAYR